nr:hypothetical protein [Kibdelosporangium sp. MJ126-NF4]
MLGEDQQGRSPVEGVGFAAEQPGLFQSGGAAGDAGAIETHL